MSSIEADYTYKQIDEPASEPVSLAEAKLHMRVDLGDDDVLIAGLIAVAREQCELEARRSFVSRKMRYTCHQWHTDLGKILPQRPAAEITAVRCYDWDDVAHEIDAAQYRLSDDNRVRLRHDFQWPVRVRPVDGFEIEYIAGYGDASAVPARYKQAILLLVAHWYANREAVVVGQGYSAMVLPMAVKSLLQTDRGDFF